MFPPPENTSNPGTGIWNIEEKKTYKPLKSSTVKKELGGSRCVGSSHGWLVYVDQQAALCLFNPLTLARIHLPTIKPLLSLVDIHKAKGDEWVVYTSKGKGIFGTDYLRDRFILKAILSADPFHNNNFSYGVIVIYCNSFTNQPISEKKLAFWRCGDLTWTPLDGCQEFYCDITCYNNKLFALGLDGSVEVWDFDKSFAIKKTTYIKPCFPQRSVETSQSYGKKFPKYLYLVESSGDLLLVVRFIKVFPAASRSTSDLICPYMTMLFHVYKMDFNRKEWIPVHSLGDRALFLGNAHHSLSLSTQHVSNVSEKLQENSIYFTDDYHLRVSVSDISPGGHDLGIFNLEDGGVVTIYHFKSFCVEPTPFWFVPNPWSLEK